MANAFAASIIDAVLGLTLSATDQAGGNRVSLHGLALGAGSDGVREIAIARFEAASLRVASGPLVLEIGEFALHELAAQVRIEDGRPRLLSLRAADARAAGVKVHGPLDFPPRAEGSPPGTWMLAPLGSANGTLRAEIVDAHLLFDADVTVPVRQGQVDFKDATVEHVGPDSRMGASRLGFYVDAPNGRSYLYQFTSAPVAGVEFERRGAFLGPWVTDRGRVHLQVFGEWLLRQPWSGQPMGFTEQARLLFERTAVSGEIRPGDGKLEASGLRAELVGRAEGRNVVRLHSEAVGRGLDLEVDSVAVRDAVGNLGAMEAGCDAVEGALKLRVFVENGQMRFAADLAEVKLSGLRMGPSPVSSPGARGRETAQSSRTSTG